jgi:hypothetical protein
VKGRPSDIDGEHYATRIPAFVGIVTATAQQQQGVQQQQLQLPQKKPDAGAGCEL